MKNTNYCKKLFRYFSIFEYEKEEKYLREMHKSGWRFLKVTGLGVYHFEKCTPADVIYQLDYNQDSKEHKDEYLQMFSDCGWEHIQEYAGYSYFRKPAAEMNGDEEIFCDNESKLQMMERVLKGRMLPLLIIFFCCLVPQFVINIFSTRNYAAAGVIAGVLLLYIAVFTYAVVNYLKAKNDRR
ncbi:MAG: DUF2812 domain-containing protein [Clostridia bacterium]|nr:DUF2812 domain-containing protein [Clostridia bacterium]